MPENKRRKKLFEGLYLEGRPPINVGRHLERRTSTAAPRSRSPTCSGDQLFTFTVLSVASYRIYDGPLHEPRERACTTGSTSSTRPTSSTRTTRSTRSTTARTRATSRSRRSASPAARSFAEYPLDTFRRLEFGVGRRQGRASSTATRASRQQICQQQRDQRAALLPQQRLAGARLGCGSSRRRRASRSSARSPGAPSRVGRDRGARASAASCSARRSTPTCASTCASAPTSALLALRGRGFYSTGDNPDYFYFGGNMELRGYPYYGFAGQPGLLRQRRAARCPLIHLAATPIGILGPLRGTVFFGIGGRPLQGPALPVLDAATPATPTSKTRSSASRSRAGACRTAARRGASACSSSSSATRCTSTGRSTRTSRRPARAGTSASGSGTTSRRLGGGAAPAPVSARSTGPLAD